MKRRIAYVVILAIAVVLVGLTAGVVLCHRDAPAAKRIAETTFGLILPEFAYADSTFGPPAPPPPPPIP
jgi:hypothetical protein